DAGDWGPQLVGHVHDQLPPAAVRRLGLAPRLPHLALLLSDAEHVGGKSSPRPGHGVEDVQRDCQAGHREGSWEDEVSHRLRGRAVHVDAYERVEDADYRRTQKAAR